MKKRQTESIKKWIVRILAIVLALLFILPPLIQQLVYYL